jgi:F-type H+-transporting ATPase subunit b
MNKKYAWFIVAFLLSVGLGFAGEGSHGEGNLESPLVLIWKGINIAIVVGALIYFFRKPFTEWLENYKRTITEKLEEAQKDYEKAKEELENAKKTLEEAQRKYEESVQTAKELAEKEREEIINQAKEIAERTLEKAEKAIEVEINKAKEELLQFATEKALELSEKTLKELFQDKEVQKAYIERMLEKLSKN